MRRSRIGVHEHPRIGADLAHVRALVTQLIAALQNSYAKSTGCSKHALRALDHLDHLHVRLEDDYEIAAGRGFAHATYQSEALVPVLKVPRELRRGRVRAGRLTVDEHRDLAAHLRGVIAAVFELHHRIQREAGHRFAEAMADILYDISQCRNALTHRLLGEHGIDGIYTDEEPPGAPSSRAIQPPTAHEPWRSIRGEA